jgi:ABC-type proline/glycine betaine transport system permease subunit
MLDFDKQYIPLDNWINDFIDWLVAGYRWFFQGIKWPVEFTLTGIEHGLVAIHPLIVIAFFTLVAWRLSGVKLSIFTACYPGVYRSFGALAGHHDYPCHGTLRGGVLHRGGHSTGYPGRTQQPL